VQLFNQLVVAALPLVPKNVVKIVAKRYIAGSALQDAVCVTSNLMSAGIGSTIDVLGNKRQCRYYKLVEQLHVV
jgi:hypothetical protein